MPVSVDVTELDGVPVDEHDCVRLGVTDGVGPCDGVKDAETDWLPVFACEDVWLGVSEGDWDAVTVSVAVCVSEAVSVAVTDAVDVCEADWVIVRVCEGLWLGVPDMLCDCVDESDHEGVTEGVTDGVRTCVGVRDGDACCDPVRLGVDDWLPDRDAVIDAETLALCDIVCDIVLDCELDEDLEAV